MWFSYRFQTGDFGQTLQKLAFSWDLRRKKKSSISLGVLVPSAAALRVFVSRLIKAAQMAALKNLNVWYQTSMFCDGKQKKMLTLLLLRVFNVRCCFVGLKAVSHSHHIHDTLIAWIHVKIRGKSKKSGLYVTFSQMHHKWTTLKPRRNYK